MSADSAVIVGCMDPWEELALAFCRSSERAAQELVQRQALVTQRNEVRMRIPGADRALTQANANLAAIQAEYVQVVTRQKPALVYGICGLVAVAGLALLLSPKTTAIGVLLTFVAGAAAAGSAVFFWRKKKEAHDKVTAWEQEVARLWAAAKALRTTDASLGDQIQSIRPSTAVRAVGRVYFPATIETVGGYGVALDGSGAVPDARFRLADFTYDAAELSQIIGAIEHLKHPPVMLQPAQGAGAGDVDALHGEEVLLRDTVTRFARFVGSVPTTDVSLPLLPRSELTRAGFRLDGRSGLPFPGTILVESSSMRFVAAIGRLNETLGSVRLQGAAPKEALQRSYETIAGLLGQYRELRTTSMGKIHGQLLGAMGRSSWCAVHFYCPKATRNPAWIQRRLGVDVDRAHEMHQGELMTAFSGDEEIRQRLDARPELIDRLDRAWMALDELRQGIEELRSAALVSAGGVGVAAAPSAATYSGVIRGLESQREQVVRQYRDVVREIVFGSRRPLIEMSKLPRLSLDPDTGVWRNETAGTEYADFEEIECTQVLRLHEDLLFPVWRHLWTEKADFRKSELFRTNEQLLRMSEKESEKLISIGNQFRDDMRTTREVLKQVEGELGGKLDQMRGTRDALTALGLLGKEGAQTLGEASLAALDAGAGAALRHAEVRETMLALEPQAQTERRERAADPIDLIGSPAILFQASPAEWFRARLAAGKSPEPAEGTIVERIVIAGMAGGR
jgi:hypothetical protein